MKPIRYCVLCLILMSVLLFATPGLSVADNQKFVLKLATQDFPPFSYLADPSANALPDQTVAGPAADIINLVCAEMETECVLKVLPWRRAQYDTREAGLYHGLFLIGWNQKRTEWLHFSPPILETEYGFFVLDTNPLIYKKFEDIKGYRVGVFGPSNTSRSLEKIKNEMGDFIIDMRPDDISGFKKLEIGRVQAVYSNKSVGFEILKQQGIKNVRYAGRHRALNYYIGFAKNNIAKSFVDEFNNTFLDLYKQQKIQPILERYQMTPAKQDI